MLLKNKISEWKLDVLKSDKKKAAVRLVDLEARSRKNSLIFYGLPDTFDKDENCIEKLESFIKNEMKINGNVHIQRAHRMGVPKKPVEKDGTVNIGSKVGTPRPIIASFIDFRTRETIRQARMKLSDAYGIGEDLPYEIRSARKSVVEQLKKYKAEGKKATILYPCRLLVDGVIVKKVDIAEYCV